MQYDLDNGDVNLLVSAIGTSIAAYDQAVRDYPTVNLVMVYGEEYRARMVELRARLQFPDALPAASADASLDQRSPGERITPPDSPSTMANRAADSIARAIRTHMTPS